MTELLSETIKFQTSSSPTFSCKIKIERNIARDKGVFSVSGGKRDLRIYAVTSKIFLETCPKFNTKISKIQRNFW